MDPAQETDRPALGLLARVACFAPGVSIPRELLLATLESENEEDSAPSVEPLAVEDGLARLVELGLVEDEADRAVRLHQLVAAFTRQAMNEGVAEAVGAVAEGARPYYERALAIFDQKLGPEHPNTQIVRKNLAALGAADKSG